MGGTPMLSNMISSGMASSVPPAQTVISSGSSGVAPIAGSLPIPASGQVAQNSSSASFTSTAPTVTGTSSLGMSQPLSNLQTGMSMNQNMMSGTGTTGMPSGTGNMMPTPGMSQQIQPGMQPVGVNSNNSVTNMPLNQQTSSTIQPAQSKGTYPDSDKASLFSSPDWRNRYDSKPAPSLCDAYHGYRNASASETQYVGKADFLVFRAMDQHGFLGQLQEKKLCAVIQLPSQTLLLSVSDKAYRLIGMLFPGDMVVFKPQIPNQQQQQQLQAQQHPHLQQLQQQQQQQQPQQQLPQLQQQQQPLMQLQQQQPAHAAPATAAAHAASTTATATTTAAAAAADPKCSNSHNRWWVRV
ncbi:UNVERIFIED_CONTAM: Mediator of RNA polymerase II transcription subunit [Sesamum radiatum]|uniref:Mediator of RNA polymerase II transcription subunit n=1 Tax=Sesamum radiatum TaxID=300843 RepID=A0AAW2VLL2_SESRA